jgi:hypothetical protein
MPAGIGMEFGGILPDPGHERDGLRGPRSIRQVVWLTGISLELMRIERYGLVASVTFFCITIRSIRAALLVIFAQWHGPKEKRL